MTETDIQLLVQQLSKEANVELIETHISWVILTDEHVYKLKKPIRYPFLNYGKLIRRKYYCEREIELNGRYSDVYLEVVPVYRTDDEVLLAKGSEIIDYAVKMKRIDGKYRMDQMINENKVTNVDMKKLALKLASFHQKAEIIHKEFCARDMIERFANIRMVKPFLYEELGVTVDEQINEAILDANHFINTHVPLFENRGKYGYVRDLHGDLHARNIFLTKDPILFDCIEFNDEHRQIDLLDEIAFLIMDLEAKGRDELADAFLETYFKVLPIISSPKEEQLFAFYRSYRANVRAKVNALRARQATSKKEKEALLETVTHYLDLMVHYTYQFNGLSAASELEQYSG